MAQSSGPISQGTSAERQFTDVLWRDLLGDEPGVLGDTNGTAYAFTPATDSNFASIGSSSIRSTARVAGFVHSIPTGQPESIEIPVASGSARTDVISLRYDPSYTGLPGPVRLYRIAGTSAAIPTYDDVPPGGVEDLPLYAVTRQPGQALNQATVVRMFPRIAPSLFLGDANSPLPTNSPLGTRLRRGGQHFLRMLDGSNTPIWAPDGTGEWATGVTTTSSFIFSPEFNNAWTTIPGIGFTVPAVPLGKILTVKFKAPLAYVSGGFLRVRLRINAVEVDRGGLSAVDPLWGSINLEAPHTGTGGAAAIDVQIHRSAGDGNIRSDDLGRVRLVYQIN